MAVLEAKSLRKAVVPSSLIENPSPGNLQSTRLALHVNEDGSSCLVYVASGCQVYRFKIMMDNALVSKGKESLLIPEQTQVMDSSLLERCPHRSEVQSVVLAQTDSEWRILCLILMVVLAWYWEVWIPMVTLLSQNWILVAKMETGLHIQCCLWIVVLEKVAVARSFSKSIDIYDQDIHLRTLHTLWYPSSLNFMHNLSHVNGSSNILAVTEGCQLTMWDLRMKENGGCLHRICGSVGDVLYTVCSSSTGNIAVAGADRTVTIYDPRRWSALSRWVHCSKYEITGLAFSSIDSNYIYVQGVDYEIFCGRWRESSKVFSFRGDSNWLGFSKCSNRDVLGAWSDSGSIFVTDVVAEEIQINT